MIKNDLKRINKVFKMTENHFQLSLGGYSIKIDCTNKTKTHLFSLRYLNKKKGKKILWHFKVIA